MNQEKQREAYEKMLKKCPDILTPMKATRWSPVGKNTIYAALKNGEIEAYTYKGGYIFTKDAFIDYVLDYKWDCDGNYGKVRELYDSEKQKFRSIFQRLDPDINMDYVRLVEFCWYNGSEAPDYFDESTYHDDFYDEV